MSLPAGVIGVAVDAVPSTTGPVTNPVVSVTPSMNLIWSATGTSLASCCTGNTPIPGWVVLPAVDQVGWITPDTRTGVTGWTYLVTVSFTVAGTPITVSGAIQVFQDQTVDYTTDVAGTLTAAAEYPIGGLALNTWVPTYASLPSGLTAAQTGYTAICQADDLVYVWSGSAWPASGHGFPVDGPVGSAGPTGPAGPANSLSIGTVTSGTAAASIGGTPPTQTLNLTLPVGPTGATGGVGPTGSVGATGTRGSDWFTGSGAPGTVGGAISGDYYLDTSGTGNYYSFDGTTWTLKGSLLGPTGSTGASSTWHVGSGVPSSGLGANGDMYLNAATGDVYGPKTAGAWGSIQENIVGPSAPQATAGTQGTIQLGGGDLGGSATAVTVPGKVSYLVPVTKTANYTMAANDFVAANTSGGAFTVTFPTAPADKTRVAVKKIDSSTNAVSLALGGSDVFNIASGPTTGSLTLQNQALIAQYASSSAIWYVQSTDVPLSGLDSRYVQQGSPVLSGTASGSGVATAATANTLALRDSNANLSAANHLGGYTSTATAAGTTTLTVASYQIQVFTGTTTQTAALPVASTLVLGQSWTVINLSTGTVTVQSSGANTVVSIPGGSQSTITCILASGTSASSWSATPPYAPLANLSSYLTTSAAASTYAPLASPTFTGTPTLPTPVINGTPTGTGVAMAATASTLALRDANGNLTAVNMLDGYATTATAAGTTVLTAASVYNQFFTGSSTQTVTMPVASTCAQGQSWMIMNQSTGAVTIQSSGSNTILVLAAGTATIITCILNSGTTAASWNTMYFADVVTSGKVLTTQNSLTLSGTDGTSLAFPSGGIATAATASTVAARDTNANLTTNNLLESYATTATSGSTVTLTVSSAYQQFFTGSTAQTVTMPVASTCVLGQSWQIVNNSTATLTVQSSGANTVMALPGNTQATITCILASGTSASSWSAASIPAHFTMLVQGGTRATGYGDMPEGVYFPGTFLLNAINCRIGTVDGGGTNSGGIYTNTTNASTGSALSGASVSSVAWTSTRSTLVTGPWTIAAGTYAAWNFTAVGTTPGARFFVDFIGSYL